MTREAHRILVRSVNWLGDAVMTTPALLRLREAYPKASITLLTPAKLAELWRGHPAINEVIPATPEDGLLALARKLRAGRFDLGVVFPNSPRSALELWLGGVRRRIGYASRWRRLLLTEAVEPRSGIVMMRKRSVAEIRSLIAAPLPSPLLPESSHQIHHYLHLVAQVGANPLRLAPSLQVGEAQLVAFRERFLPGDLNSRGTILLGLNAGAEYGPAKRWPEERFIAAAAQMFQQTKCTWLLFGGPSDREANERIAAGLKAAQPLSPGSPSRVVNLAGLTGLSELLAGLHLCRVVLTNDTGPMHVAAAVGTPVVVPVGSTSMELTGPGLPGDARHQFVRGVAECAPCFLRICPVDFRCMQNISVDQVVSALHRALANRPQDLH